MKKMIVSVLIVSMVMILPLFAQGQGEVAYPERDITTVVVWGAGGGTDVCNRVVMAEMSKELGVNVNVVNKTGGVSGSIGMLDAFSKKADGYTLCGLSESNVTAGVMGGWENRMDVWDIFIIGGSPDVISVTPDTPYQTIEDLVAAAKANPQSIKAAAGGAGSIHHLNLLAFEQGTEIEFNFIPYPGSAPSQNAAMTGEVDVVITSVAEQAQLIMAGKLRPLGVLVEDAFDLDGTTLVSTFDAFPALSNYLPLSQAIGFAVKAEAPQNVKDTLYAAFDKAMQSEAVKEFGKKNFYVLSGKRGPEANAIFKNLEAVFGYTLKDLGSATVDPETLGIERP
ncbi:tripartite tricarboxylate transporter substrate binding protein [uncultured Sphaerochaeta sp.]|uniref:Bug family tripartite tricarboxylate transporter substrate binding protein n=1 Tax=uncultured Sphaerochaeta sp. TaxID=886478 RepID=UPI002A0A4925|nr:tripartite tricarboxylate transporter substrate binding protein [uncultured Sphaerochaeta sp.]